MCIWRQCNKDPSASLGMTVLGERIGSQEWCAAFLEDGSIGEREAHLCCLRKHPSAAFFIGRCPKVVFKSRVTSHNNDMSSPLEKGRAKGAGWIHEAV